MMSVEAKTCPKCQGEMVRGFLFTGVVVPWFEGVPQEAPLGGARPPAGQGLPSASFRCTGCGYLELYASQEQGPR